MDNQKFSDEVSKRLATVSFICAAFVVSLHVSGGPLWFRRIICLNRVAVPMFFVISGFLFAGGMAGDGWYKRSVVKRIQSLLLPYVLWNVLYYIFFIVLDAVAGKVGVRFGGIENVHAMMYANWDLLGFSPIYFPALGLLWYVRTLFVLVLISPLFLIMERKTGGGGQWCLSLISLCVVLGNAWMI